MGLCLLPSNYQTTFEDEKNRIIAAVVEWGQTDCRMELNIDQFESLVAIKGSDRAISAENSMFRRYIMQGKSAIGLTLDDFLLPELSLTSQKTDGLILDGVSALEFDHFGVWDSGRRCTMTTFKRHLGEIESIKYKILLISRIKGFVTAETDSPKRSLGEYLVLLQKLDATDQTICKGIIQGDATRDIANRVGLTCRSVELRRQKVLDLFGFQRPVEIVKLIVRLEENGLLVGWC